MENQGELNTVLKKKRGKEREREREREREVLFPVVLREGSLYLVASFISLIAL